MPRLFWAVAAATFLCVTSAQSSNFSYYDKPAHAGTDQTKTAPVPAGPFASLAKTGAGMGLASNGGFETNGGAGTTDLTAWTLVDQAGSSGSWYAQTGTTSPTNGFTVQAPTEGSFAAMTDQTGGGSHVLYQDVAVPAEGATLHFDLYLKNQASDYHVPDPATLDFTVTPNQQFRADVMDPAAGDFDVGAGVLDNIYQTLPGDALESGYTTVSHSLDAFAGQTVRLRFAEVDNQFFFNVGVDNVHLTGKPAVGVTPDPLAFGDQAVGTTSAPESVTLENTGGADLDVSVVGTASAPFAEVGGTCGAAPFTLTPGASCTLEFEFSPTATGPVSQNISVESNAASSPDTFELTGNGVQAGVSLTPGSLDFGDQAVGTTSAPESVTVENTGSADLDISAVGTPSAPFADAGGTCGAAPFTLAPGATCTLDYEFSPTATGTVSQNISVESNASSSPDAFDLTGNGVQAGASLAPGSLDFGDQVVGTVSPGQAVTLENTGDSDLDVASVSPASAPFFESGGTCGAAPFTLVPGATCTLAYEFAPTAAGPASDSISVESNAPSSPDGFQLTGNGIQSALSLSSGSVSFGTIHLGTSDSAMVTVTNTGSAPLEITGLSGLAEPFSVTGGSCTPVPTTVPVDGSCTIEIGFNGASKGSFSDTLLIESNAPASPHALAVAGAVAFLEPIPASSPRGLALLALLVMLMGVTAGRRRLG